MCYPCVYCLGDERMPLLHLIAHLILRHRCKEFEIREIIGGMA